MIGMACLAGYWVPPPLLHRFLPHRRPRRGASPGKEVSKLQLPLHFPVFRLTVLASLLALRTHQTAEIGRCHREELLAVLATPTVINQFAAVLVTKSDVAVQKSDGSASGAGRLHIAYTVGTRN